jgi:hypothetical protein
MQGRISRIWLRHLLFGTLGSSREYTLGVTDDIECSFVDQSRRNTCCGLKGFRYRIRFYHRFQILQSPVLGEKEIERMDSWKGKVVGVKGSLEGIEFCCCVPCNAIVATPASNHIFHRTDKRSQTSRCPRCSTNAT